MDRIEQEVDFGFGSKNAPLCSEACDVEPYLKVQPDPHKNSMAASLRPNLPLSSVA